MPGVHNRLQATRKKPRIRSHARLNADVGRNEGGVDVRLRDYVLGLGLSTVLLLTGCTTHSTATSFEPISPGTRIAILPLRDCTMPEQEDCHGSGNIASSIIASTFSKERNVSMRTRQIGFSFSEYP